MLHKTIVMVLISFIYSQINGHEVPLMEPEYLAVFDRISMVEHNCRANCNKSFTSDGQIVR